MVDFVASRPCHFVHTGDKVERTFYIRSTKVTHFWESRPSWTCSTLATMSMATKRQQIGEKVDCRQCVPVLRAPLMYWHVNNNWKMKLVDMNLITITRDKVAHNFTEWSWTIQKLTLALIWDLDVWTHQRFYLQSKFCNSYNVDRHAHLCQVHPVGMRSWYLYDSPVKSEKFETDRLSWKQYYLASMLQLVIMFSESS